MPADFLYHGTTAAILLKLKHAGIAPRAAMKTRDNWAHTVTSNKHAVYLTDAYPWHFAACASKGKEKGLILEIKKDLLLPWQLCPDEDWLEQATRKLSPSKECPHLAQLDWGMKKRTKHYRKTARFNPKMAEFSLQQMGTAAYYGVIPWAWVNRYVIIDWTALKPEMRLRAIDSMVMIENYKILADRHRAFVRWFFGDPVEAAELTGNQMWRSIHTSGMTDGIKELFDKNDAAMAECMKHRDGLQVVNYTGDEHGGNQ